MSNQYILQTEEEAIIAEDGALIWDEEVHDQSSLNYFDANPAVVDESTISEGYVTANDNTQYLSILNTDTDDITLEDLNLTVENEEASSLQSTFKKDSAEPPKDSQEDDAELIIFTMDDGSDDLYGIQMAQDEDGNIQKYQFKLRTGADGQLVPIPETVVLLENTESLENNLDTNQNENSENPEEMAASQQSDDFFLVPPAIDPSQFSIDNPEILSSEIGIKQFYEKGPNSLMEQTDEAQDSNNVDPQMLQHCMDPEDAPFQEQLNKLCIKTETLDRSLTSDVSNQSPTVKEEYLENHIDIDILNSSIQNQNLSALEEEPPEYSNSEFNNYQEIQEETVELERELEPVVDQLFPKGGHEQMVRHFMDENGHIEIHYEDSIIEGNTDSTELPGECSIEGGSTAYAILQQNLDNSVNLAMPQYEEQETTEEPLAGPQVLPSTLEVLQTYQQSTNQLVVTKSHSSVEKENALKKPLINVKLMLVYPEKENVNSLADNNSMKPNPRSLLRPSFLKQKEKSLKPTNELSDIYHKRFAKNKDAMRAKNFHNFLNRTTIPHAPIRQERQPRKQKIKPVIGRSDEEIIVQEVIISENGFVENLTSRFDKDKKLRITAIVELSDSEEETDTFHQGIDEDIHQSKGNRRKTQHSPRNPLESAINIIEINSDGEENIISNSDTANSRLEINKKVCSPNSLKRRRGRPPKSKSKFSKVPVFSKNIDQKEFATDIDRQEFCCPYCTKTFPSQNSLNTHKIHHNLENSLKNQTNMPPRPSIMPRQSLLPKVEYNHKCDECQQTFKNSILLKRHVCTKTVTYSCSVCLKIFQDVKLLNSHKKTHAKLNLIKNTSVLKVTPKKMFPRPSIVRTSPKKTGTTFKCPECPRVCDSADRLSVHVKMHKQFVCTSCLTPFGSKILLDSHVRTNCVKLKAKSNVMKKMRTSTMQTPPRRISTLKSSASAKTPQTVTSEVKCDKCDLKFPNFRSMHIHQVQKHGIPSPNVNLLTKPKQAGQKTKTTHGGIPINGRMKAAYAVLREKFQRTENS